MAMNVKVMINVQLSTIATLVLALAIKHLTSALLMAMNVDLTPIVYMSLPKVRIFVSPKGNISSKGR